MTTTNPNWTYGEEGLAFPVDVEQVWRAGPHFFVCSDLMASNLLSRTLGGKAPRPTLLYCDPPWNQGNVNAFRTKAGLKAAEHTYLGLYEAIISFGKTFSVPMFIEGGNREKNRVSDLLPGPTRQMFDIIYYRKHPCTLHYSGPGPSPVGAETLTGMDDDYTPSTVMKAYGASGVVLDPCAGRGVTSRSAEDCGWVSVNNELNPRRVSAALARMKAHAGHQPERVA